MLPKAFQNPLLLLDACCLINLFATGRIEEILNTLPYRFATSRLVATREVLTMAHTSDTEGSREREVISVARLESFANLTLLDLSTDEDASNFVGFAADLDDGEASVCALAVTQRGGVATDDRKALRILASKAPQVPTIQTPELLFEWAQLLKPSESEVMHVLRAVRHRARFYPRHDAPRFQWWVSFFP